MERPGKLTKHKVKIEFISQAQGRRVPIQLREAFQAEVNRMLKEGHIERLNEITDEQFIQPVVITVKKDESVKLALDACALKNEILEDEYREPNLEYLVDLVAEQLDSNVEGKALHTSLDMRYAHGQVPLDGSTAKHCNFQIIGGQATCTYRYVTLVFMVQP